jgi:hypothetical protein
MRKPTDPTAAVDRLDPEDASPSIEMSDTEGKLILAAVDLYRRQRLPGKDRNAAIRYALKDWLIGQGMWPHAMPPDGID